MWKAIDAAIVRMKRMFEMLFEKISVPPASGLQKAAVLMKAASPALLLLTLVAGSPDRALAGGWNGQQSGRLTGSEIFTVIGNTVTFKQGAAKTYLTVDGKFENAQLLGINSVWIVDIYGNTLSGISSVAGGSSISGSKGSTSWAGVSGPAGYSSGSGWGSKDPWLQLASNSDLYLGSGKSSSGYSVGTFSFTGLDELNYWEYKIGIDYLVASPGGAILKNGALLAAGKGNTGRAYVPAPEMSTVVSFGLVLGLSLVGMVARRPRSRRC
jgi:hypothetical protein